MHFRLLEATLTSGALMPGGLLDREEDAEKPPAMAGRSNHIKLLTHGVELELGGGCTWMVDASAEPRSTRDRANDGISQILRQIQ
jgi:hypothetical protein